MNKQVQDGDNDSKEPSAKMDTILRFVRATKEVFGQRKGGPTGSNRLLRTSFASMGFGTVPVHLIVRDKLYESGKDFQRTFVEFDTAVQTFLIGLVVFIVIVWILLGYGLQQHYKKASYINLFLSGIGLSVLVVLVPNSIIAIWTFF